MSYLLINFSFTELFSQSNKKSQKVNNYVEWHLPYISKFQLQQKTLSHSSTDLAGTWANTKSVFTWVCPGFPIPTSTSLQGKPYSSGERKPPHLQGICKCFCWTTRLNLTYVTYTDDTLTFHMGCQHFFNLSLLRNIIRRNPNVFYQNST